VLKVKPSNINVSHKDCFFFTHSFGKKSRAEKELGSVQRSTRTTVTKCGMRQFRFV